MRATVILSALAAATAASWSAPIWAQEQPTLTVETSAAHGDYIADVAGMSLYMFENDDRGENGTAAVSNCYDQCAENWPPLILDGEIDAAEGVEAELIGTTERTDGSLQVTYGGYPLYYFVRDESAGDTTGQGVGEVWYLVSPDGEIIAD